MQDPASPEQELQLLEQKRLAGTLTHEEGERLAALQVPPLAIGGFDVNAAAAEVQAAAAAPWPGDAPSPAAAQPAAGAEVDVDPVEPSTWQVVPEATGWEAAAPSEASPAAWETAAAEPLELTAQEWAVPSQDAVEPFATAEAEPPLAATPEPSAPAAPAASLAHEGDPAEPAGGFSWDAPAPAPSYAPDPTSSWLIGDAPPDDFDAPPAEVEAPPASAVDAPPPPAADAPPPPAAEAWVSAGGWSVDSGSEPLGEVPVEALSVEGATLESGGSFAPASVELPELDLGDSAPPATPAAASAPDEIAIDDAGDAQEPAPATPDEALPPIDLGAPTAELSWGDLAVPAGDAGIDLAAFSAPPALAAEHEATTLWSLDAAPPLDDPEVDVEVEAIDAAPPAPEEILEVGDGDLVEVVEEDAAPPLELAQDAPAAEADADLPLLDALAPLDAPLAAAIDVSPSPGAADAAAGAPSLALAAAPGEPVVEEDVPEPTVDVVVTDDLAALALDAEPDPEPKPEPAALLEPLFPSELAPAAALEPLFAVEHEPEPAAVVEPAVAALEPLEVAEPFAPGAEPVASAAPTAFEGALAPPAAEPPARGAFDPFADFSEAAPAASPPAPAPVPPAEPSAFVEGRHRVVLHTADGQVKRGTLTDVALNAAALLLEPQAGGAPESIPCERIRAIFFMLAAGEAPAAPEGKKVRVTFRDGRQVAGFSPDYAPERTGFFMIPADTRTHTARIWVYRTSVRQVAVS